MRYLIIGAHAIAFHAKPRNTKDFDVLVEPTRENAKRVLPNRIDIANHISGVNFEQAWAGRVQGRFGTEEAFYIGKLDLIRNKEAVARPQDLADADLLRRW